MLRRLTSTLPILGILIALGLYLHAASLYSGATSNEPSRGGYQHFRNYWCELYNDVTFTGQVNSGRSYALASTLALVITLFFFWFSVSALFVEYTRLRLTLRFAGAIAAAAAMFIFTPLHDLVITVAAPLGFIAILATCIGLARQRHWPLLILGIAGIAVALLDYLLWKMQLLQPHQPLIQKSAFILIFLWVLVTAIAVLRIPQDRVNLSTTTPPQ